MATNLNNSKHTYNDFNGCGECGAEVTRRYKSDDICVGCAVKLRLSNNLPRSQGQAQSLGSEFFYPGKRCNKGAHFVKLPADGSSRQCKECKPNKPGRPADIYRLDRTAPDLIITRAAAKALKSPVYRTGELCPKGHDSWRYVIDSKCIECDKKRLKFHRRRPIT